MDGNAGAIELTGVRPIQVSAWRIEGAGAGDAGWSGTLEIAGSDLTTLFGFLGRTVSLRLHAPGADATWSGSARITSLPMTAVATATASVQIEGAGPLTAG